MEKPDLFDQPAMDPYDREEQCRKTIRVVTRAILARIAVGVLLLVMVIRAGASPAVLGLCAFVLLVAVSGALPLGKELAKQRRLLKECLKEQEELETKE